MPIRFACRFGSFLASLAALAPVLAPALAPALAAVLAPVLLLGSGATANAQTAVAMAHTVSPRARNATDLGVAPAGLKLPAITLRFSLSAAQERALQTLAAEQGNPVSPRYHHWLTPEEYGSRFGAAPEEIAALAAWLESQGFAVVATARSRTFLTVAGTAETVARAFGTAIHIVTVAGETHYTTLADPALPRAVAAMVGGISGLDDFRATPRLQVHHPGPEPAPQPAPQYTSATTGSHYLAPGDLYTIYDINPLLNASIKGTGVSIAVLGQTDISLPDVAAFRSAAGLTANAPTVKVFFSDPGTSAADIDQAQLDVEWAGAIAPAATIVYVNSADVLATSLTQAIDNNLAPIVSLSYGGCESDFGTSAIAFYNLLLRQANVQGQTVVAPAGNLGATDCDAGVVSATHGLAVDFPASSPFVTGVGGTMFNENGGTYFAATNGASGAGSALSYIPESVWNESGAFASLTASGGGRSAYFTKPAFQVGMGVPNDFARDVPDLALAAGAAHDGFLFCSQGSCTNGSRNAAGALNVTGSTGASVPVFAGVLALLEQRIKTSVGNANPVIYGLANSTYAGSVFHDVTSGSNASACTLGTAGCPAGGAIGFAASAGYDLASGWGSVDAFNLVTDWLLVTPAGISSTVGQGLSTTTLTVTPSAVNAGTTVTLTAMVASGSTTLTATPTGTVQFLIDNVPVGMGPAVSASGTASTTIATSALAAGTHLVTAAYSGDAIYAGSRGAGTLTVAVNIAGGFTLTPASSTLTVAGGSTSPGLVFTVAATNGFTGNVTFGLSSTTPSLGLGYSFNVNPVVVTSSAGSGATTLMIDAFLSNSLGGRGLVQHPPPSISKGSTSMPAGWAMTSSGIVLGCVLGWVPRRRRKGMPLLVAACMVLLLGFAGCGGGSSSMPPGKTVTKTPAGAYTLLITATGTNAAGSVVSQNATVALVVQ